MEPLDNEKLVEDGGEVEGKETKPTNEQPKKRLKSVI